MSSALKALAQKAKDRLRAISGANVEEKEEKKTSSACLSAKVQYALIMGQNKITNDPLYNKVKKLLNKEDDILNPLSYLIDYTVYNKLSTTEKEKYIYKLSKRYTEIKAYILKELGSEN